MNPLCRFQSLCGIQTRSEVGIEKGFNAKGWVIQRFAKYLFALQKSLDGWNIKLGNTREIPPTSLFAMQGWHTGTHKSFKGCEGLWAHLCMCMGTGRGRGGWQHRFFSPYFSFTSTMQRDYKRVFSLDLKCDLGNEHYFKWFLLLQVVSLLNERPLFITSCPSDYIKQRWANIFKQVCFYSIFYITGK